MKINQKQPIMNIKEAIQALKKTENPPLHQPKKTKKTHKKGKITTII